MTTDVLTGLLVAAFFIIPRDNVERVSVDLIEINHYYDDQGRLVFVQQIFYDWSWAERRFQVRAWRLVKQPEQIPVWNWDDRRWVCLWLDGTPSGIPAEQCRKVYSRHQRETFLQYDPELEERKILPQEKRKGLNQCQRK